jgi:hypothetical protein
MWEYVTQAIDAGIFYTYYLFDRVKYSHDWLAGHLPFLFRRFTVRKFTKMSLVLVTPLVFGTYATSAFASEVNSAISFEAFQSTPASSSVADDLLSRNKPRVPGGSGCDDPDDLIEHPECRPAIDVKDDVLARSKPRVKGGSGCDDPQDLIEHPECRPAIELKDQLTAREASEGPRGADRPGEDNGGRRGGRG